MTKKLIITEKPSVARDFARVLNVNGRQNGYIENDYVRTYPIMQGLYTDARGIEDYYLDRTVEVKSALTDKVNETDKKFSPCEFVNFENNGVNVGVAVNKIFNLHIKRITRIS